jgi:hypothetical protein
MYITMALITQFKPVDQGPPTLRAITIALAVERYFQGKIGFPPEKAAAPILERVDGTGSSLLRLRRWPIVSVASLKVCGATLAVLGPTDSDAGQPVVITQDGMFLQHRTGFFPEGVANCEASYTAGWAPEELADLALVGAMVVHLLLAEGTVLGQGAVTIGDQQIQAVVRNPKDYQMIVDTIDRYASRPF